MISIKEKITLEFPSGKMEEFTRTELETLYKELGVYLGKNKETYTPYVDPLTTWPYQSHDNQLSTINLGHQQR